MYLGIDLGTSGVKLLLLDDAHTVVATADAAVPQLRPQPTWSEQHPADWWAAVETAVAQLHAQAPAAWAQVRGLGLSGHMHGAVVLDAQGQVLRPAILWNDGRASAECAQLESVVPTSRQITGNLAMPGFTAPKLLWLRTHEPAVFDQIRTVLLPKDWLRLQLTGDAGSDMSDASGTLWLDVQARAWSPAMLQACGLDVSHMPTLAEGSAPTGTLRSDVARRWGLGDSIVVAAGAGDNAASAVGVGARTAGQGFVSLGTSGVVFRVTDAFAPATERAVHAFAHALPQRWHHMSVMLSAASAFGWVTRLTGRGDEAQLSDAVSVLNTTRQAQAPLFLPYLRVAPKIGALRAAQHFEALVVLRLRVDDAVRNGPDAQFVDVVADRIGDGHFAEVDVADAANREVDAARPGLAILGERDVRGQREIIRRFRNRLLVDRIAVEGLKADRHVLRTLVATLSRYDYLVKTSRRRAFFLRVGRLRREERKSAN